MRQAWLSILHHLVHSSNQPRGTGAALTLFQMDTQTWEVTLFTQEPITCKIQTQSQVPISTAPTAPGAGGRGGTQTRPPCPPPPCAGLLLAHSLSLPLLSPTSQGDPQLHHLLPPQSERFFGSCDLGQERGEERAPTQDVAEGPEEGAADRTPQTQALGPEGGKDSLRAEGRV